jgi:hypothetical protein
MQESSMPGRRRRAGDDGRLASEEELGVVATSDHNINPDLERKMAKRAGSETIEVPASHAVYVSRPEDVARLIERAAKASAQ